MALSNPLTEKEVEESKAAQQLCSRHLFPEDAVQDPEALLHAIVQHVPLFEQQPPELQQGPGGGGGGQVTVHAQARAKDKSKSSGAPQRQQEMVQGLQVQQVGRGRAGKHVCVMCVYVYVCVRACVCVCVRGLCGAILCVTVCSSNVCGSVGVYSMSPNAARTACASCGLHVLGSLHQGMCEASPLTTCTACYACALLACCATCVACMHQAPCAQARKAPHYIAYTRYLLTLHAPTACAACSLHVPGPLCTGTQGASLHRVHQVSPNTACTHCLHAL